MSGRKQNLNFMGQQQASPIDTTRDYAMVSQGLRQPKVEKSLTPLNQSSSGFKKYIRKIGKKQPLQNKVVGLNDLQTLIS